MASSDTSYVSDIVPYTNIYKILRFIHSFNSTNSFRATAALNDQVKGRVIFSKVILQKKIE